MRGRTGIQHHPDDKLEYIDARVFQKDVGDGNIRSEACWEADCAQSGLDGYSEVFGEYSMDSRTITLYRGAVSAFSGAISYASGDPPVINEVHLRLRPIETAILTIGHESAHGLGYDLTLGQPHYRAEYFGYVALLNYRAIPPQGDAK